VVEFFLKFEALDFTPFLDLQFLLDRYYVMGDLRDQLVDSMVCAGSIYKS
jgi:hypothetical protein